MCGLCRQCNTVIAQSGCVQGWHAGSEVPVLCCVKCISRLSFFNCRNFVLGTCKFFLQCIYDVRAV